MIKYLKEKRINKEKYKQLKTISDLTIVEYDKKGKGITRPELAYILYLVYDKYWNKYKKELFSKDFFYQDRYLYMPELYGKYEVEEREYLTPKIKVKNELTNIQSKDEETIEIIQEVIKETSLMSYNDLIIQVTRLPKNLNKIN